MARTTSIAFPSMFDIARNKVAVLEDSASVVNRSRLLMMTEPTELYNEPNFGAGLKRHLWKYNTPNEIAVMRDRIAAQLKAWEPCCNADKTSFADGLLFTGSEEPVRTQEFNQVKMTVGISTIFEDGTREMIFGD